MRHYSERELEGLLGLDEAIAGMRLAFLEFANGRASVQPRVSTDLGGMRINTMAALLPALGYCGSKVYTAFQSRFSFVILLFSMADGRLIASFDAGVLTRLRTAAVSALAVERLARKDSASLVIFGSGTQAAGHALALGKCLPIKVIHVVARGGAEAFARETEAITGIETRVAKAEDAVPRADVIVTATRSPVPLFDGGLVPDGCTIIAVGSARADAAEIDATTVSRCARIVVESADAARHEAGDLILAAKAAVDGWSKMGELGALLADRIAGRQSAAEINLFESLGFALEDVAIASLAHAKLREQGAQ